MSAPDRDTNDRPATSGKAISGEIDMAIIGQRQRPALSRPIGKPNDQRKAR